MATEKPTTATQETVIYLGTSLNGDRHVGHGSVFIGGKLPDHLAQAIKEDASLAALFVPLSKAGAAKRDLENPKTAIAKAFAATQG